MQCHIGNQLRPVHSGIEFGSNDNNHVNNGSAWRSVIGNGFAIVKFIGRLLRK